MSAFETYLRELVLRRSATVSETAHYDLLKALLDDVGSHLTPKVYALIHPHNVGDGIPDLALYDEHQPNNTRPSRGVVEAKPTYADLSLTAESEQTRRYTLGYGVTLVTNLYQFIVVTRDDTSVVFEERYDLAKSANEFYSLASEPRLMAAQHEKALTEYLMRAMRRVAPLSSPQDVALILASYARQARALIERSDADLTTLEHMRNQLGKALGIRFENADAEAFFRSTLVQTLFYGVFSAWVLWHENGAKADDKFDLWQDVRGLNVPVIHEIFYEISKPALLRPLGLEILLEWTADALNRVDRTAFFDRFERGNAVQYFYEPFLEAFDPELRRQLGVWYTPPEVVEYMVARVDAALKGDLGIVDGLADPNVYVLDPCCGTGAYLVGALRQIYATLKNRDGEVLAAQATAKAMRERVFGFEILPAPFVVAHLQIGMLLNNLSAPLKKGGRAGVYLTNALTGWTVSEQIPLDMPELQREREAAASVKQSKPILVVIGNPPYSGFAGLAVKEEAELTSSYRTTSDPLIPKPEGQGLNDLYVRFFRMAERRIVEQTGRGVVCYISNYSWLDGLSHTGMRERYLTTFDQIAIDSLNGDKYRTGKRTPDGLPDPSIFSTEFNREGIQVGTAIATMVRTGKGANGEIRYRDLWGTGKRTQLRSEADRKSSIVYDVFRPSAALGLPFTPRKVGVDYLNWIKLTDLFPAYFSGVQTKRDEVLVSFERDLLVKRMEQYFDPSISDEVMEQIAPRLMGDANRFNAREVRAHLIRRGFLKENIVRFCYRPFDMRWIYWEPETKLLGEKSPDYFPQVQPGNIWLEARQRSNTTQFDRGYVATALADNFGNGFSSFVPLYLFNKGANTEQSSFLEPLRRPNLSADALAAVERLGIEPETLFYHAIAIMHTPSYRIENAGALQQDWARIPLPQDADLLRQSAALGQRLAVLLDPEQPVSGVTQGEPVADLAGIGVLSVADGHAPDFGLAAGWGYSGRGGIVMPGQGRVGQQNDGAIDVYLNETTYWRNIPTEVWAYTLGGYQVLKKWLSYREKRVLGRDLKPEEAREFMHIARRITAILAMNEALDANYRAVADAAHDL